MSRRVAIVVALGIAVAVIGGLAIGFGPADLLRGRLTHITPILAGLTAALWAVMVLAEGRAKRILPLFTPVFAGLALAAALLILGPLAPRALSGEGVRGWSTYHYYVGSKYFAETGYFDLYGATLAADDAFLAEGGDPEAGWADAKEARDMRSYSLRPRGEIVASFDPSRMRTERLGSLGADSRYFRERVRSSDRRKLVLDLGYNPAPPWLLLGAPLTNAIDPGGPGFALITASDLAMHVAVFAALWWAFGLRVACIALLWLLTMPINRNRLVGGLFNYDWLAATTLALCAWHKDRPALSAVALSWAAMTRVFPGLMALPIVVGVLWGLLRGRRSPKATRFTVVFCLACALLLAASHSTGRGASTWPEWAEKISIHSEHHPRTGSKRVGLGRLALHHPHPKKFWRVPRPLSAEQEVRTHRRKVAITGFGLALLLAALRRRRAAEAMLLMLFAAWLATTSSRYYASAWLLFFVLPTVGARAGPGRWAGGMLMAMLAAFYAPPSLTARYLAFNYEALGMFSGLCVVFLIGDWWARRAEDGDGGVVDEADPEAVPEPDLEADAGAAPRTPVSLPGAPSAPQWALVMLRPPLRPAFYWSLVMLRRTAGSRRSRQRQAAAPASRGR